MMAFSLDNIAVLNVANVFYQCILMSFSKDEGLKRLNIANYLGKRGIVWMELNPNKAPIEIIKEGTFGGTYFRDIYSGIMKNGTKIHGKNLFR